MLRSQRFQDNKNLISVNVQAKKNIISKILSNLLFLKLFMLAGENESCLFTLFLMISKFCFASVKLNVMF